MAAQRRKTKRQPTQTPVPDDRTAVKAAWIGSIGVLGAALISGVFLLAANGSDDDEPTRDNPSASVLPSRPDLLVRSEQCSEPSVSSELTAGEVVIDGRCDPAPNSPVGTYSEPRQDGDLVVERLNNGDVRRGECLVEGQSISNMAGAASNQWVRYIADQDAAYVPTIWTHGEEALDDCAA